jgi:hypothetical protein
MGCLMIIHVESFLESNNARAHDRERKLSNALEKAKPGDEIVLQSAIYDLSWIYIPAALCADLTIVGEPGRPRARLEGAQKFIEATREAKTKLHWIDMTVLNWSGRSKKQGLRMAAKQEAGSMPPSIQISKVSNW